jgi:hypothetical protein
MKINCMVYIISGKNGLFQFILFLDVVENITKFI